MNILHRKKIVLLGLMSKMPVAGVVWQTMHYLIGFQRLGYDVYYIEQHGINPNKFISVGDTSDGADGAASFIGQVMARFGMADKWAYQALHSDGRCFGMSREAIKQLHLDAALVINLHGGTIPLPEHYQRNRLVFLETDPVDLQVELEEGRQQTLDYLSPHCAFFTFGENLGRPGCLLPVSERFQFKPTRQPVVLDFWEMSSTPPASAPFTTIGNWEQPHRQVVFRGETYHWSKHYEFLKFLDLPSRVGGGTKFELGLARYNADVERMLNHHGWAVRPAISFSEDANDYRNYIWNSRGEFTVAKDQNIRLRSGWFSDRSATYLAAGRPVITQDTAFGESLPSGEGLFAFQTMDDVLAAVDQINSDYGRHARAATSVARECFSSDVVLGRLLVEMGV